MEQTKNQLKAAAAVILADIDKDSKAAARRVRKATLDIAKAGKTYRKLSLEGEKEA